MSLYAHSAETVQPLSTDISSHAFASSLPRESSKRGNGMPSLGNRARNDRGEHRPNTSIANGKRLHGDWLADELCKRSEKEVANDTGMTPKAVGNLRQRRNKISFDNFVELCIADPQFAAAFAEYVGLIRPGEAEFAGALTQAFNAYQRKQGRE